jgi:hypothetical protein
MTALTHPSAQNPAHLFDPAAANAGTAAAESAPSSPLHWSASGRLLAAMSLAAGLWLVVAWAVLAPAATR